MHFFISKLIMNESILSYFRLGHSNPEESGLARRQEKDIHLPRTQLNLLSFNLEPLTDTLQELYLRSNGFRGLPKQLENRKFSRLRKLDLSHNPLGGKRLAGYFTEFCRLNLSEFRVAQKRR